MPCTVITEDMKPLQALIMLRHDFFKSANVGQKTYSFHLLRI